MKPNFLLYLIIPLFFSQSCRVKKQMAIIEEPKEVSRVATENSGKVLFNQVILNKNTSEAISYIAEVDYKDAKQSASLNIEVAAKRNQYIYLNAKAFGLVNVARVMIQPDSIRILDLINRKYISASYRFMQSYSNAPMGFEQLQNLAFGNSLFDPQSNTVIDSLNQILWLITDLGGTTQKAAYSKELKTQSVVLTEQDKGQEMQVKFEDFRMFEGISYPHEILINIQGEKKMDCKFSISNFAQVIRKEPTFVVPKSYKVQVY
jgi:hypothetical protein